MGAIRVGTSGFQFDDWKGSVYPEGMTNRLMLEFYEKELGFDTVEVNYTYYHLPSARTSEAMIKKTSPDFKFVIRSHKDMTHDIWEDKGKKVLKDNSQVFSQFKEGIKPMIQSGKLGCVLVQFPSFFWPNYNNFRYMEACKERLEDVPLVFEFRNQAWVRESAFNFLEQNNIGFCAVDEPHIPRLMRFVPRVTGDIAYVKLHGRNPKWFSAPKEERYNYLYSQEELNSFSNDITSMSGSATKSFVYSNNCPRGYALKNALMMKKLLGILKDLNVSQSYALRDVDLEDGKES